MFVQVQSPSSFMAASVVSINNSFLPLSPFCTIIPLWESWVSFFLAHSFIAYYSNTSHYFSYILFVLLFLFICNNFFSPVNILISSNWHLKIVVLGLVAASLKLQKTKLTSVLFICVRVGMGGKIDMEFLFPYLLS